MSIKGKARIVAAQAVGILGRVHKVKGQIIVLRNGNGGRTRDWQRMVKKVVETALPNWAMASTDKSQVVFTCLLTRGQK